MTFEEAFGLLRADLEEQETYEERLAEEHHAEKHWAMHKVHRVRADLLRGVISTINELLTQCMD